MTKKIMILGVWMFCATWVNPGTALFPFLPSLMVADASTSTLATPDPTKELQPEGYTAEQTQKNATSAQSLVEQKNAAMEFSETTDLTLPAAYQPFEVAASTTPGGANNLFVKVDKDGKATVQLNGIGYVGSFDIKTGQIKVTVPSPNLSVAETWTLQVKKDGLIGTSSYSLVFFEKKISTVISGKSLSNQTYYFGTFESIKGVLLFESYSKPSTSGPGEGWNKRYEYKKDLSSGKLLVRAMYKEEFGPNRNMTSKTYYAYGYKEGFVTVNREMVNGVVTYHGSSDFKFNSTSSLYSFHEIKIFSYDISPDIFFQIMDVNDAYKLEHASGIKQDIKRRRDTRMTITTEYVKLSPMSFYDSKMVIVTRDPIWPSTTPRVEHYIIVGMPDINPGYGDDIRIDQGQTTENGYMVKYGATIVNNRLVGYGLTFSKQGQQPVIVNFPRVRTVTLAGIRYSVSFANGRIQLVRIF